MKLYKRQFVVAYQKLLTLFIGITDDSQLFANPVIVREKYSTGFRIKNDYMTELFCPLNTLYSRQFTRDLVRGEI